MNEIGFRKNGDQEQPWADFEQNYERTAGHELTAEGSGDVQNDAEEQVLKGLREQLDVILASLSGGSVLLIESEMGKDYPKMREKVSNVLVGNENRLFFDRTVDPPLRIGVYTPRQS